MALKLTMTCGPYDRARALIDGTVKADGIDLEIHVNPSPGRHTKIDGKEFDAAEFYTGTYIADLHYKSLGYTAIPIFVKRMFRHSYIYINKRSGIRSPADLNGKRIGVQNWLTTTAVWARGLLEDEYGLDPKSVTWIADRVSGVGDWKPPVWLKVEIIPKGEHAIRLACSRENRRGDHHRHLGAASSPGNRFSISQLRGAGARLLPAHGFLSDHAHAADQELCLRKKSLGSDEPVQRLAGIEKEVL